MARRIELCPTAELPPGERRIVDVEGLPHSVGVFNVDGEYYALANVCPHQLAPLCEGTITGETKGPAAGEYEMVRKGEIIMCPWHGWQFDITDGTSVFNPHEHSTRQYEATVESKADLLVDEDAEEGDETLPDEAGDETGDADESNEVAEYGTSLSGEEPPIESYDVDAEADVVVLYV
jgi:nitrite reductase/ring-hydroxylating ferredoxin subunit